MPSRCIHWDYDCRRGIFAKHWLCSISHSPFFDGRWGWKQATGTRGKAIYFRASFRTVHRILWELSDAILLSVDIHISFFLATLFFEWESGVWLYEPFDGSNRFFFNVKSKSISRPLWSQLHSSQFLSCQINPSFFQSFGVCQAQLTLPLPSGLAIHRAWHSKQHALHSVLWKGVVGHTLGLLFILLCTSVLLIWESLTAPWVPIIQDRGKIRWFPSRSWKPLYR